MLNSRQFGSDSSLLTTSKNIDKINVKHMNLISGIVDTKIILELEVNDNEFDELEWALVQTHLYEMGLWDMSKCQA